ncbi:MAG: HNH/ENDO VII family nuclease [Candidatus Bruticola sp.]
MGTGLHGGFGFTVGVRESKLFSRVTFEGTVKVNGNICDVSRIVYQRHDIDFSKRDQNTGLTNLERMKNGKPPVGNDGNPVQLHHLLQKEVGSMVEIREVTHQEYYKILHGLVDKGASFRNNPLLKKQYTSFRIAYWKWRASQYKKKRQ